MTLDLAAFDVLTFDCYGTLIDWEVGLSAAFAQLLGPHGRRPEPEALLTSFARHEAAAEAGPYRPYREVLAGCARAICYEQSVTSTAAEWAAFGASVADWPPFPDAAAALAALHARFRLGVITNCDDDLFAASNRKLGEPFDWVVTAQQARAYKPSHAPFELALARIDAPRERILHVAQSLFHDHVPARELGLRSVWVDRRAGRSGSGATPAATATPDLVVPDMATLARLCGT